MKINSKRIFTHFDFLILIFITPLIISSTYLVYEINDGLLYKQILYTTLGFISAGIMFFIPFRRLSWIIPFFYWIGIALLLSVDLFGITILGAKRWLEIPLIGLTIQPSEIFKPLYILMLAYLITENPPPPTGYNLKDFLRLSFYIVLPFVLILQEPDLGTAGILLMVGFAILFIIGVNWKIWTTIAIVLALASPYAYNSLHDYQKKRIEDFLGEKPSYHVQQSIIAIGSGGMSGKEKDDATQAQLKFLPIATSDFIFAYVVERLGFWGALLLILNYAFLILHLLSFNYLNEKDYFLRVFSNGLAIMIFLYMSINIAMTIGFMPVVGVPLPMFSHGGSSFVNFMVLFGILQNLLAFRFKFLYNSTHHKLGS